MKCCVGALTVELHIGDSQSLKDRRRVVASIKERLRRRLNVSVAEARSEDTWQRAGLIISCAGAAPGGVEQTLRSAAELIESDPRVLATAPELRFYE